MKRTLFYTILIFLTLILNPVFSQVNSIFTPFVSRIKVQSEKSSIKISWKDTSDVEGNCILYRHTALVSADNLSQAIKIARIPKGVEYYEDFPPYTQTNYFYAVFMEDEDSLMHEVFIPFRNITSKAAFITEKTKDDSPALITALKAWVGKDSIQLSFKCSKPTSELFIYRNTEPIEDKNDILSANLIATLSGASSSYTDYPVPGIGYYYGIIDSNLIKTGSYIFKAGENITVVPVELELTSTERVGLPVLPSSRPKPLPYLSISRAYQTGRQLSASIIDSIPEKKTISDTSAEAVNALLKNTDTGSEQELLQTVLKQDKNPAGGSEQAMLADILEADFITGNFESARVKLLEFQKIRRTNEIEASVHFYLGQIYYFTGDFKSAFTEFLFAEEYFYMESRPWIDTLFKRLRISSSDID
ncbi:MAG TPA: hypothetical protein DCO79_01325 [Spirochaeta sp.]|nr:hypothetical protein [Spirochaeta sp.]